MQSVIKRIEEKYKKPHQVDVRSGDTVRVHQKIREGSKERIQVFEGLVIKTARKGSHTATITVRRITSGIGVEKTYLTNSPLITKIQVTKRSKVRRNYLSYMRERTGKSARLSSVDFDKEEVNKVPEPPKEDTAKAEAPSEASEASASDSKDKVSSEKTEQKAEKVEAKEDKKDEKPADESAESKSDQK